MALLISGGSANQLEAAVVRRRSLIGSRDRVTAEILVARQQIERTLALRNVFLRAEPPNRATPLEERFRQRLQRQELFDQLVGSLNTVESREWWTPLESPGHVATTVEQVRKATALELDKAQAQHAALEQVRRTLNDKMNAMKRRRAALDRAVKKAREDSRKLEDLLKRLSIEELSDQQIQKAREWLDTREAVLVSAGATLATLRRGLEDQEARAEIETIQTALKGVSRCIEGIQAEVTRATRNDEAIEGSVVSHRRQIVDALAPAVSELFQRMQVNRVFAGIDWTADLQLRGLLGDQVVDPVLFSAGQRQDLALAFFLVRAYALGGSFVLDEPLAHLDDLNRVSLLDSLRGFALSAAGRTPTTRLVLTTASWTTARHLCEKFMRLDAAREMPMLRVYQLGGNVVQGVSAKQVYPGPTTPEGEGVQNG